MSATILTAAVVVALVYLALRAQIHCTQDVDEPPAILPSIPFFSPVLGALRQGQKFWVHLLRQYQLPIYTLRLLLARLYIVNDPSLLPLIDRQSKVLSFSLLEADMARNLLGISKSTHETLRRKSSDGSSHIVTFNRAVRRVLTPEPALDSMSQRTIERLTTSLDKLRRQPSSTVPLFRWVQHEMVMAITDAEYGPGNPFRDPEFEQMWYKYESHVSTLSIRPHQLLPRSALQAREFLAAGFERYIAQFKFHLNINLELDNPHPDQHKGEASPFLRTRYTHHTTGGLSPSDTARCKLLPCLALLFNTAPAAFWMVYHLFSDRALLARCRAELEKGAGAGAVPGGGDTITNREGAQGKVLVRAVSLDWIRSGCPVLMATLHEVFRFRGTGMPLVRRVLEDHRLGGRWVLRKGGIVLMPTSVMYFDEGVLGRDAGEFRPVRFLEEHHHGDGGDDGARLRKMARGLRVFGGGATRCPRRHFVEDQVLAFAALLVMRFGLRPVEAEGGGSWAQPETGSSFRIGLSRAFSMPESDLEVEISGRSPEQQCMVLWHESRSKRNGCE